jgi:hypothetical protein
MAGPALVAFAPMPLAVARALVPAPARVVPVAPGRALAVIILAHYSRGAPLRYHEVAGLVAVRLGARPAGYVDSMLVDDEQSMAGGRGIWNVPKELTRFTFGAGFAEAEGILRATWRPPRRALRIPRAGGAFLGALDGTLVRGTLHGSLRAAPVRPRLEIPPGSPLERLRTARPIAGLAGEIDVLAGVAPRREFK